MSQANEKNLGHLVAGPPERGLVLKATIILSLLGLIVYVWWVCDDHFFLALIEGILFLLFICSCVLVFFEQRLAFYENGIVTHRLFGSSTLCFDDIEKYSFSRVLLKSANESEYRYDFVLYPKPEIYPKKFKIVIDKESQGLLPVFTHLREVIALRILDEYFRNKSFQWTSKAKVYENGIEPLSDLKNEFGRFSFMNFQEFEKGVFEEREVNFLKQDAVMFWRGLEWMIFLMNPLFGMNSVRFKMAKGSEYAIYRHGDVEPFLKFDCAEPNFFPGYEVFQIILAEKRAES